MSQHLSRLLAGVAHGTVVLGLLWGALPARAQEAGANPDPLVEAREARSWLMRIHDAGKKKNFQGTFVVSAGGTVSSSRIVHFYEGSNQFERIESMDG